MKRSKKKWLNPTRKPIWPADAKYTPKGERLPIAIHLPKDDAA